MAAFTTRLQQQQLAGASHRARAAFSFPGTSRRTARVGLSHAAQHSSSQRSLLVVRAAAEQEQEVKPVARAAVEEQEEESWIPVCKPEDLPKGVRKEFEVAGRPVLMFWYRNQLYAIEARSPAEGAYSEGFIKAKFTQDFCIECPSTQSLFSLKDGSIVSWYPTNPVLRALTPQSTCRKMEVYPVKLAQEAIYVDVASGVRTSVKQRADKGGAGTSLENNNVFTVQPNVYFDGQDPLEESASLYQTGPAQKTNPATVTVGIVALGVVAVAGSATAIYYESVIGLAAFWVVLGGCVGLYGFNYVNSRVPDEKPPQ